jgi:predicted HTH domain antitoxin
LEGADWIVTTERPISELKRDFDTLAKKVLAYKQILARILQAACDEFKDCSYDEIENCLSNPIVGAVPVDWDVRSEKVSLLKNEDANYQEGKVVYDILFHARLPKPKSNRVLKMIMNVEAQKTHDTGYPLINRAIYYISRIMSAEKNDVFVHDEYGKIQKVYSIWICAHSNHSLYNVVEKYQFERSVCDTGTSADFRFKMQDSTDDYKLLNVVMFNLHDNSGRYPSKVPVLNMLPELLSKSSKEDKVKLLVEEYGLRLTKENKSEVNEMCNISEQIYEDGISKGRAEGRAEGKNEIRKDVAVSLFKKRNFSMAEIAEIISCPEEQVRLWLSEEIKA